MNCPIETRNPDMLVAYAAGELDLDSVRELDRHLAGCAACRTMAEDQAAVWQALETWEAPPVSADFDRRLYRRIDAGEPSSWWQRLARSFLTMPLRQALPLTATAGLLLFAGLLLRHPDPVAPAPPRAEIVRAEQVESTLDDLELLRQFGPAGSAESVHPDAM